MPMTRRDVGELSARAVREAESFVSQRETDAERAKGKAFGEITSAIPIGVGALAGGFLSTRYKEAGAVIPLGLLLGGLAVVGSFLPMSPFGQWAALARKAGYGAMLSSGVIWAAGHGAIFAERTASPSPGAPSAGPPPPRGALGSAPFGSAPVPQGTPAQQPAYAQPQQPAYGQPGAQQQAPQQASMPATVQDFLDIVTRGRR